MDTILPTTLVGSYPQPDWLIDRAKLAGRFPPRVRAKELWRIAPERLEQAQDDATLLAIRDQERAGLDIINRRRVSGWDSDVGRHRKTLIQGAGRSCRVYRHCGSVVTASESCHSDCATRKLLTSANKSCNCRLVYASSKFGLQAAHTRMLRSRV
jgi:hypothetical protein